jgi:hypothetical protein
MASELAGQVIVVRRFNNYAIALRPVEIQSLCAIASMR